MSINNLYIFTKDTNATATEQGYEYQKLKTLKTWLENRINEVTDIIYCDYEEDIFESNIDQKKVKFRQVKLYSTNFSFSKVEIEKSLINFFMLFVKRDDQSDEISFLFETNSDIAKETRGNDGDLLKEWWQNQESISNDLLVRCKARVKKIIDEYINEACEKAVTDESKAKFQKAKSWYEQLGDEKWDRFIQSIKWRFDGIEQENAIPLLLNEIEILLSQLPLPLKTDRISTYLSILHYEIAQRTIQTDENERILSNELLDARLLNEGSKEDQWYSDVYLKWLQVVEVKQFNVGAFYEVVNAARYCRTQLYDTNHADVWLRLLTQYIELSGTIIPCRKKAIYEYLFLLLSPNPITSEPKGTIDGNEDWIRYYFNEFENRNSIGDIEENITLLQIVETYHLINKLSLDGKEIDLWKGVIKQFIDENIASSRNIDEQCQLYEYKGHFLFHLNPLTQLKERVELGIEIYRQIIPLLPDTKIYSISRLNDQIDQILKMFIQRGVDNETIEQIETFLSEIEDYAAKTGKQHNAAHNLVERGTLYLKNRSEQNSLKALDCFYKATDLWYLNETKEAFILGLINIAQIYASLGMRFAAKYYGLCGVWASLHFGEQKTIKRLSDCFAIVFHSDFRQGAWISALKDFEKYINARIEFRPEDLNFEEDSLFRKTLLDVACILAITPIIHPEMNEFIEQRKTNLGWFYSEHLQILVEDFTAKFQEESILKRVITSSISDVPLNDLGENRMITFKVLGIKWQISFQNTASLTAIGEEFCSLLQATLCEIASYGKDFHLLQMPIVIMITQEDGYCNKINQRSSHEHSIWDLGVPAFDSTEVAKIQFHYGYIGANIKRLINDLSLLPNDQFEELFMELYVKRKLGEKGLSINTYQKVYFNLLMHEDFDEVKRVAFKPPDYTELDIQQPDLLLFFNDLSDKYNQKQSFKHISGRYKNIFPSVSITLENWRRDVEFQATIQKFHTDGWLDWQILMALRNFILSQKANQYVASIQYTSKEEGIRIFGAEFSRLESLEESECYMEFPISVLNSKVFEFYLNNTLTDTLHSFGLENNMQFPNFKAVHTFLSRKFAFNEDDQSENNPLADINIKVE